MSLALSLKRAVLSVIFDTVGPMNMTEEDFAFIEMAGEYGARRDGDDTILPKPQTPLDLVREGQVERQDISTGATEILDTRPGKADPFREGRDSGAGWAPPPAPATIKPAATAGWTPPSPVTSEHDRAQMLPSDRGPEPQEASEILDTREPPNTPNVFDAPPDYTKAFSMAPQTNDGPKTGP